MPPAYQVKRPEPLAVRNIEVTFSDNLDALSNDKAEKHDRDVGLDYLKTISATITGHETLSGKQVTLGRMEGVLLQVQDIVGDRESLCDICDEHSEGLADLYRAGYKERGTERDRGVLPEYHSWGDVLMVDIIRLDPKFRGHGIGLLALDRLVKHVARASRDWKMEGLVVLNPSMMNDRRVQANTHEDVQQKLFEYYKLFGLEVLTKETSRHCALSVISWPNGGRTSRRSYHICCSRSLSEG